MSWDVLIYFQERGTKKETSDSVSFETREEALVALKKLEAALETAGADTAVILESGRHRVSFIKADYRRTKLYEAPDGPIIIGNSWSRPEW